MRTTIATFVMTVGLIVAAASPVLAAEDVKILAASYSYGSEFADVTMLVRHLLAEGKVFQANPNSLHVDPHPGMNKALVVFCEVRGKTSIFSVGEGEDVSAELMQEKAKPVADASAEEASIRAPGTEPGHTAVDGLPGANTHTAYVFRGDQTIKVNLRKARINPEFDLKLQPGDTIYVPESVF